MLQLILGDDAAKTLMEVSSALRLKTVEMVFEMDGQRFSRYTPWLCLRPMLDGPLEDPGLLDMPYISGEFLTAYGFLDLISKFLDNQGRIILDPIPADEGLRDRFEIFIDIDNKFPKALTLFREGRSLLFEASWFLKSLYENLTDFVIPLRREVHTGLSTHMARGAIFLAFFEGYEPFDLALELAHELGHQALMVLQSTDPLITSPHDEPVYSGVRGTLRPAIQCLHAAAALAYMVVFSRGVIARNGAHLIRSREQAYVDCLALGATLNALDKACDFSERGQRIMIELAELMVDDS